ncbi:MAG: hypothetical protein EZS28_022545 [Streblomastix strix]|uniref:Uncharacterized protein n=1 Tax=Streblomastix strix TaxID=222440 RepID=A0A5J4VHX1_9EUKA|nr:MAG: hypothetical protein EZS28_022545 [Streblomastix strix]
MPNVNHTDYMIFPRACALAETLWSPYKQKDYVDFLSRLNPVTKRLDKMGVNYCKASLKPPPHPVVQKQESSASLSEES